MRLTAAHVTFLRGILAIAIALAAMTLLALSATPAHAGGDPAEPPKQQFNASVAWDDRQNYSSRSYAEYSAYPPRTYTIGTYYRYRLGDISTELVSKSTTKTSWPAGYTDYWSVYGVAFQVPGTTSAFAGMFWQAAACSKGPQMSVSRREDSSMTYSVKNTTGTLLFLTTDGGSKWRFIRPGGTVNGRSAGPITKAEVRGAPSNSTSLCASLYVTPSAHP